MDRRGHKCLIFKRENGLKTWFKKQKNGIFCGDNFLEKRNYEYEENTLKRKEIDNFILNFFLFIFKNKIPTEFSKNLI